MTSIDVADAAQALGAARLEKWTMDGTLIPLSAAVQAGRLGVHEIASAVQRGELFEVWVANLPYIPAALVELSQEQSTEICFSLDGQSASSKLSFLLKCHGGLGGQTIAEALRSDVPLSRICELARASVCS